MNVFVFRHRSPLTDHRSPLTDYSLFLPATRRREIFRQENLATFVAFVRGASAPFQNFVLKLGGLCSRVASVQLEKTRQPLKPLFPTTN